MKNLSAFDRARARFDGAVPAHFSQAGVGDRLPPLVLCFRVHRVGRRANDEVRLFLTELGGEMPLVVRIEHLGRRQILRVAHRRACVDHRTIVSIWSSLSEMSFLKLW